MVLGAQIGQLHPRSVVTGVGMPHGMSGRKKVARLNPPAPGTPN